MGVEGIIGVTKCLELQQQAFLKIACPYASGFKRLQKPQPDEVLFLKQGLIKVLDKNGLKTRGNLFKVVTQIAILVKGFNENLKPKPVFRFKLQPGRLFTQMAV